MTLPQRPLLAPEKRTAATATVMAGFHADTLKEVADTVGREAVVVVGMAQNPFVKRARAALTAAGVPFTYLEYGSYLSEWKRRLAIKMWSGWPTFPQVYVRGVLIGGFKETEAGLQDGTLKQQMGA